MGSWLDPAHVDVGLDSRAVTFENLEFEKPHPREAMLR